MVEENKITLDISLLKNEVQLDEIKALQPSVEKAIQSLRDRSCAGNEFLGWMDLPERMAGEELEKIESIAQEIRDKADVLIIIGIGGSYLGARAAIDLLTPAFHAEPQKPEIIYLGHHLSMDYIAELLAYLKGKKIYVNVISKSGTTTEPGVAFRIIKDFMLKSFSPTEVKDRIIATTDRSRGALRQMANNEGYRNFIIPDDVGGRFSVLTPVGLLPIAAAGIDIDQLLAGAREMRQLVSAESDIYTNPALLYAAIRQLLYRKGKSIEILASFEPYLHYFCEWWKQLYGESEGKDGKGLFPASVNFTTDLHSLGQYIQEGQRILFETFLFFRQSGSNVKIPAFDDDLDGMNYLAGRTIQHVNEQAYRGTTLAHYDGGVPNMTVFIPKRNEYYLGQLFYMFEYAVAVSGLLLGVNPFNQPGVEAYKQNMFALLGKPGFEMQNKKLLQRLKEL